MDPTSSSDGYGTVTGTLQRSGGIGNLGFPGERALPRIWPCAGEVFAFISEERDGTPVASAPAADDGTFTLTLLPGTYYLAGSSPTFQFHPPIAAPCRGRGVLHVAAGDVISDAVVNCPMK
jgi:hypothetical protein